MPGHLERSNERGRSDPTGPRPTAWVKDHAAKVCKPRRGERARRLSRLAARLAPQSGSAAPPGGKPPAFRLAPLPLPRLEGSAFQPARRGLFRAQVPRKGGAFPQSRRRSPRLSFTGPTVIWTSLSTSQASGLSKRSRRQGLQALKGRPNEAQANGLGRRS